MGKFRTWVFNNVKRRKKHGRNSRLGLGLAVPFPLFFSSLFSVLRCCMSRHTYYTVLLQNVCYRAQCFSAEVGSHKETDLAAVTFQSVFSPAAWSVHG